MPFCLAIQPNNLIRYFLRRTKMTDNFDEALDQLYCELTEREPEDVEFAWPKERVFIDVYESSGGIEGGGLWGFWDDPYSNQARIIRSYRKIGSEKLSNLLTKSRKFRKLIRTSDYDDRESEFGPERFAEFDEIEDRIFTELKEIIPIMQSWVDTHSITASKFGLLGKCIAHAYGLKTLAREVLISIKN